MDTLNSAEVTPAEYSTDGISISILVSTADDFAEMSRSNPDVFAAFCRFVANEEYSVFSRIVKRLYGSVCALGMQFPRTAVEVRNFLLSPLDASVLPHRWPLYSWISFPWSVPAISLALLSFDDDVMCVKWGITLQYCYLSLRSINLLKRGFLETILSNRVVVASLHLTYGTLDPFKCVKNMTDPSTINGTKLLHELIAQVFPINLLLQVCRDSGYHLGSETIQRCIDEISAKRHSIVVSKTLHIEQNGPAGSHTESLPHYQQRQPSEVYHQAHFSNTLSTTLSDVNSVTEPFWRSHPLSAATAQTQSGKYVDNGGTKSCNASIRTSKDPKSEEKLQPPKLPQSTPGKRIGGSLQTLLQTTTKIANELAIASEGDVETMKQNLQGLRQAQHHIGRCLSKLIRLYQSHAYQEQGDGRTRFADTTNRTITSLKNNHEDRCLEGPITHQSSSTSNCDLRKGDHIPQNNLLLNGECAVCMDRIISVAMVPCGHVYCSSCANRIIQARKCALCSQTPFGSLKLFISSAVA